MGKIYGGWVCVNTQEKIIKIHLSLILMMIKFFYSIFFPKQRKWLIIQDKSQGKKSTNTRIKVRKRSLINTKDFNLFIQINYARLCTIDFRRRSSVFSPSSCFFFPLTKENKQMNAKNVCSFIHKLKYLIFSSFHYYFIIRKTTSFFFCLYFGRVNATFLYFEKVLWFSCSLYSFCIRMCVCLWIVFNYFLFFRFTKHGLFFFFVSLFSVFFNR